MSSILVTGGAGFIGSHFVEYLFENSQIENVIVVDKLTYAGTWENLSHIENRNSLDLIQGDINDDHLMDSIIKNVEYVVNFAAETHVDRSISNPKPFIISNVLGAQNIFDSCLKHNKRIVHISTDEVYGSYSYGKANESSKLNPSSPYSASKASADLIALSYFKTYGLNVSITRCGNNYGVRQYPEKLIPFFIKKLKNQELVTLYGNGLNERDWVHVKDHCEGIFKVLTSGMAGSIYNIGDVEHYSNLEITNMILNAMGIGKERIEFIEDRLGHDFRYAINAEKITKELNWRPHNQLSNTLANIIESIK